MKKHEFEEKMKRLRSRVERAFEPFNWTDAMSWSPIDRKLMETRDLLRIELKKSDETD